MKPVTFILRLPSRKDVFCVTLSITEVRVYVNYFSLATQDQLAPLPLLELTTALRHLVAEQLPRLL